MARRRAYAALVALAVAGTAWLLLGDGGAEGTGRAEPRPRAIPEKDPAPKTAGERAPAKPGPSAPGAAAPEAPPASGAAALLVRVVHERGAPAADATVEAYPFEAMASFPISASRVASAVTAVDGRATLRLEQRPYWVRVTRGDDAAFPTLLAPGDEATFVLEAARELRGVVLLPDGSPAAGFLLRLSLFHAERRVEFTGKSDGTGAFRMPPVPEAWLDRLSVEVRGGIGPQPWEFEFAREELRTGAITLRLTVVRVRARVVGEDGTPVAAARVFEAPPTAPAPPSFRFVATTDADGYFESVVQQLGAFLIRAQGYAPLVWRPEAAEVSEIVLPRGVPLSGTVVDPRGRPIADAAVRLENLGLRGHVVDEAITGDDGRFRFAVADEEHVLYAFRDVEPDLCLPQLRMPGVRGGPDDLRVVLQEPIYGTVRFVAQGTGDPVQVQHLTLIVKDARGVEVAKRTWEPGSALEQVRFEVWEEGTYDLEVYTACEEPARVAGVKVVRGRGPEVSVPLVPRR